MDVNVPLLCDALQIDRDNRTLTHISKNSMEIRLTVNLFHL